jgi:hypothetical protein
MKVLGAGLLCLMVVSFASPAFAGGAEISGGYNWVTAKATGDQTWEKFPKGWYFDVAGNVTPMVSIVGAVTGNYKHFEDEAFKLKAHSFMGGVRVGNQGPVRGFGQFLIGGTQLKGDDDTSTFSASETNLTFDVGGGVDVGGPVGLRLGLDYVHVKGKDSGALLEGDDLKEVRFTVGVTFHVGK